MASKNEYNRLKQREQIAKARIKRQNESFKERFEKITISVPIGTKNRIRAKGESLNGYINKLIDRDLNNE